MGIPSITGFKGKLSDAAVDTSTLGPEAPAGDQYLTSLEKLGSVGSESSVAGTEAGDDPTLALLNALQGEDLSEDVQAHLPKVPSVEEIYAQMPNANAQTLLMNYQSVLQNLETRRDALKTALGNAAGSANEIHAVQKLLTEVEAAIHSCKMQMAKLQTAIPYQNSIYQKEIDLLKKGTPKDLNGDNILGDPATSKYIKGQRSFKQPYTDPITGEKFKAGDTQKCWINKETGNRLLFDPVTGELMGEHQGSAQIWEAASGLSEPSYYPGGLTAQTTGPNLTLTTPEYVWMEVDENGDPVVDKGAPVMLGFDVKEGKLTQKQPASDGTVVVNGVTHRYQQVYVKKMSLRTDSKPPSNLKTLDKEKWDVDASGSDIVVELSGGDPSAKLTSIRITGRYVNGKYEAASSVGLTVTAGTGANARKTPIHLDAQGYVSTCKNGIKDVRKLIETSLGKPLDAKQKAQIEDTLKHFDANSSGKTQSNETRGIVVLGLRGIIDGTSDDDLILVGKSPSGVHEEDDAYQTVVNGGEGHNFVGGSNGHISANGVTAFVWDSPNRKDIVKIGTNTYPEKGDASNKLYISVHTGGAVFLDNEADMKLKSDDVEPTGFQQGDDFFDIHTEDKLYVVHKKDTDLKKSANAIEAAGSADFEFFKSEEERIKKAIGKPASEQGDDFKVSSEIASAWQAPHAKADDELLGGFFAEFRNSSKTSAPTFEQLTQSMGAKK